MRDMTKGRAINNIICHAFPIIIGAWLQLGYNAVDSIIVGRFIGQNALASEGTASPVLNLLTLFVSGLTIGAGILLGEAFGREDDKRFRSVLSSLLILGTAFSLLVTIFGIVFINKILLFLGTPVEINEMTKAYLVLSLTSLPFTFIYNALASALKSVGDSKTPLYFLIITSILNAALDLFFIGYLGYGIVCSALTTVVSVVLSAFLSLFYMIKKQKILFPSFSELRLNKAEAIDIIKYGLPTALQQALQPIGKLFIQVAINTLGVVGIASYQIGAQIDAFALIPEQSISSSCSIFIAQNRGKERFDRIKSGYLSALSLEVLYWLFFSSLLLFTRDRVVSLFVKNSNEIVQSGSEYLFYMCFFYLLPGLTNVTQGYFRGWGKTGVTLLGTLTQIGLRTILTFVLLPLYGIKGIAFASAIGWIGMLVWELPYLCIHLSRVKCK